MTVLCSFCGSIEVLIVVMYSRYILFFYELCYQMTQLRFLLELDDESVASALRELTP